MTVTRDQAQMLATLAAACRPHGARRWDSAGTLAALEKVRDRSLASVILATIRAAADRDVETPGVIPTAGSHWSEQLKGAPFVPQSAPTGTRCTICGGVKDGPHFGHDYTPPTPKPSAEEVHARVEALKAQLEPTSGPTAPRTLDDLAAANPKLHERVEAVRQQLPKGPPMRETEDEPEEAAE